MLKILVLLVLLSAASVPAALAQDETLSQSVELRGGYTIALPADWIVPEEQDTEMTIASGERGFLAVLAPFDVEVRTLTLGGSPRQNTVIDVMQLMVGGQVQPDAITRIDGLPYATAAYEETFEDGDAITYVIEFRPATFGIVQYLARAGELDADRPLIERIVASFQPPVGGLEVVMQTAALLTGANTSGASTCLISAPAPGVVAMRVGPGASRAIVAYLPAGQTYRPIGRAQSPDGGQWFQLNRAVVAPRSLAYELWVSRAEVIEAGDCAGLLPSIAPPIIPPNAPPYAPVISGGQSGGASGASGAAGSSLPPGSGLLAPSVGIWTLTFGTEVLSSCEGTDTRRVPVTETDMDTAPITWQLVVSEAGNVITFTDLVATRRPGENTFVGSFAFEGSRNVQFYLTVESAAFINGRITWNDIFDGYACSATLGFTMTPQL